MAAPQTSNLFIDGPAGKLEAELLLPENQLEHCVALVLHPHPLFHGSMHNKVVTTLCRAVADLGIPALRFNFRGVGASAGEHDDGHGEQDDATAAAHWLTGEYPNRKLLLAGFSVGAATAIRIAERLNTAQLISCGVPTRYFSGEAITVACPWLAVHGEADDVAPWRDAEQWLTSQRNAPVVVSKPDVGHFFHGELSWLRATVKGFVSDHLPL